MTDMGEVITCYQTQFGNQIRRHGIIDFHTHLDRTIKELEYKIQRIFAQRRPFDQSAY